LAILSGNLRAENALRACGGRLSSGAALGGQGPSYEPKWPKEVVEAFRRIKAERATHRIAQPVVSWTASWRICGVATDSVVFSRTVATSTDHLADDEVAVPADRLSSHSANPRRPECPRPCRQDQELTPRAFHRPFLSSDNEGNEAVEAFGRKYHSAAAGVCTDERLLPLAAELENVPAIPLPGEEEARSVLLPTTGTGGQRGG